MKRINLSRWLVAVSLLTYAGLGFSHHQVGVGLAAANQTKGFTLH